MKKVLILCGIGALLAYVYYQQYWGYKIFDVEDVTKPTEFEYKRWGGGAITSVRVRLKGELAGGRAKVKLFESHKSNNKGALVLVKEIVGPTDIEVGSDYYSDMIRIEYIPIDVPQGHVSVSVSLR